MNNVLIVFASSTSASRMKSILSKNYGIKASISQTPKALNLSGCSYCLHLKKEDADLAWKLIKSNGLSSKGIYDSKDYRKIK